MQGDIQVLQSFAPIADEKTKVLIIGTMPSIASLAVNEYYAYKYNAFWPIISKIYGKPLNNYSDKIMAAKSLGIGLWDCLYSCERNGSADSNITKELPNNFPYLLRQYPNIKKLLFNGKKAYQLFCKFYPQLLKEYIYEILPSTSPANASVSFDNKLQLWNSAINRL